MKKTPKALLLLLATCYWLLATNDAFAQEVTKFPIKDSAITVVGSGEGIPSDDGGGTPNLPPKPTWDEFFKLFKVFNCSSRDSGFYFCPEASQDRKKFVYDRLSDALRSERYKTLLTRKGPIRVYLRPPTTDNPSGFTGGAKYGGDIVQYWGYVENISDFKLAQWSMVHETGHLIELRNPTIFNVFKAIRFYRMDGDDCYEQGSDGYYIKTYNYRNPPSGSSAESESLGEAVGMNVACGPNATCNKNEGGGGAGKPITDYPSKCSYTYKWIRDNIYGGVDFFSSGGGNQEVVSWAQQISSGLTKLGPSCLYNVQSRKICNSSNTCAAKLSGDCNGDASPAYLCTQLIIDSYNLAGNVNSFSTNTYYMERAWENKSGYRVLRSNDQASLRQLKPGDIIFMFVTYEATGLKHVVVIKNVDIDSNGNGSITIHQANSNSTLNRYTVSRWKVFPNYRDDPNARIYFGLGPRK